MGELAESMGLEMISAQEEKRRAELEQIITENMQTFIKVGRALAEISNNRLYRSTHLRFEEYCREIFDMARCRAYQLIDAAEVIEVLSTSCIQKILPKNEAQCRPLARLNPVQQTRVWNQAVETAPDGKISARHIQKTIFEVTGEEVARTVRESRDQVRREEKISKEFVRAFEELLQQIEKAKAGKYQTTSREAIAYHLDALRHAIAGDGRRFISDRPLPIEQNDLGKLKSAGFKIYRANHDSLLIEEQGTDGEWFVHQSFEDPDELETVFSNLVNHKKHLQGQ